MSHVRRLFALPFALAFVAGVSGCPDDTPQPTPDTVGADVTILPDGQSCQPGAVVECINEPAPEAVFCNETGDGTYVASCEQACANSKCQSLGPNQICYPGTVNGCVIEGSKEASFCNDSGTGYKDGVCKGPDGNDSQCRGGKCTFCSPGFRKCDGDELVVECNADGSAYEPYSQCRADRGEACTGQYCEELCAQSIKFHSYIGCDYWGVDLDNAFVPGGGRGYYDAQGAQYAIVVANPAASPLAATVEIKQLEGGVVETVPYDSQGQPLPTEPLLPGELRTYRLPRRDINGTELSPKAYQVTSSVPIIAYQFNPLENENVFSNDASLLLPSTLLGREYLVMTREQTFDELRGYLTVIAVMPGETTVSVEVTAPTEAGRMYEGTEKEADIAHMTPGETRIFTMQQFDVLNIETDRPGADLTGSRILASQRVAVFGGSEAANAPNTARCVNIDEVTGEGVCEWDMQTSCRSLLDCVNAGFNTCCADHLEQQLYPVKTWGSSYVATKSWDRGLEKDIWRIMAAEDNTKIVLVPPQSGVSIPVLDRGEWFEFESAGNFEIHAQNDKPILVGQFLAAQDAPDPNVGGIADAGDAGTGDPAFMLSIPIEQYREDYVILVPAEYAENYFNISVPAGAMVEVDGEQILDGFFTVIGTGEYSVYRQRLDPGTHTITSSEPAGVIVYGYDQYVSYAYTGGLTLDEINKETPFSNGSTN
ncbi:MAG: hypothetical protein EP329_11990 [Deltaproteobacteria bacterium]|nr:MAG: hypothetical protein EP329_11990 [Deltaproteobacteria bacterium]